MNHYLQMLLDDEVRLTSALDLCQTVNKTAADDVHRHVNKAADEIVKALALVKQAKANLKN